MARRLPNPRKLLVASVGVATLNYLPTACSKDMASSVANLLAPPLDSGKKAHPDAGDASTDAPHHINVPPSPTVANLVAPAPSDFTKRAKERG
jgi:hypothetical protein